MLIRSGTQERVLKEAPTGAGSQSVEGSVNSDSLLATLWVDSVASGTLSVSVYTLTDAGKELKLFSFPDVTAGTTNLLLKKAGVTMQRFRVAVEYSGACEYEIYVRAIAGAGESSVKILGASELETDTITVTTTPGVLIPAALEDRSGIAILNYSGAGILFISEDITKLPARAWPVQAGGGWSLDIASGVTIYAVSSSGSLDVRIAQSGG